MKLTKKAQLLLVATVLPLLLAGCTVQYNENHEPIGWLYNYLVVPTQWLLNQIASVFNGNYAIAINRINTCSCRFDANTIPSNESNACPTRKNGSIKTIYC